jgi:hypothetical protein
MIGDPDELMVKFITGGSNNFSRFSEPAADAFFAQQKTEMNAQKRVQPVKEMQKAILQKAWWIPGLWWTRAEARSARIRNPEPLPGHHQNRRLEDVWLRSKLFSVPRIVALKRFSQARMDVQGRASAILGRAWPSPVYSRREGENGSGRQVSPQQ